MGVPKKHKTRSGRNQRRAHDHLTKKIFSTCSHCGAPIRAHEVCKKCGYYRGRQVRKIR
ncbi:50S ribosomal protein L32 [Patescibacteria group bacterium]|nr:50S ribosomal protein L32 [Patescibacteria group bacterium]